MMLQRIEIEHRHRILRYEIVLGTHVVGVFSNRATETGIPIRSGVLAQSDQYIRGNDLQRGCCNWLLASKAFEAEPKAWGLAVSVPRLNSSIVWVCMNISISCWDINGSSSVGAMCIQGHAVNSTSHAFLVYLHRWIEHGLLRSFPG